MYTGIRFDSSLCRLDMSNWWFCFQGQWKNYLNRETTSVEQSNRSCLGLRGSPLFNKPLWKEGRSVLKLCSKSSCGNAGNQDSAWLQTVNSELERHLFGCRCPCTSGRLRLARAWHISLMSWSRSAYRSSYSLIALYLSLLTTYVSPPNTLLIFFRAGNHAEL